MDIKNSIEEKQETELISDTGTLWNTLSEDQQKELLLSYEESFDKENLIRHEDVIKKWSI